MCHKKQLNKQQQNCRIKITQKSDGKRRETKCHIAPFFLRTFVTLFKKSTHTKYIRDRPHFSSTLQSSIIRGYIICRMPFSATFSSMHDTSKKKINKRKTNNMHEICCFLYEMHSL